MPAVLGGSPQVQTHSGCSPRNQRYARTRTIFGPCSRRVLDHFEEVRAFGDFQWRPRSSVMSLNADHRSG